MTSFDSAFKTLNAHAERVIHFMHRIAELGMTAEECMIVIFNVDDPNGSILAEMTMPGQDWQSYRDAGMTPYARGLVSRPDMQTALDRLSPNVGRGMRAMTGVVVLLVENNSTTGFDLGSLDHRPPRVQPGAQPPQVRLVS